MCSGRGQSVAPLVRLWCVAIVNTGRDRGGISQTTSKPCNGSRSGGTRQRPRATGFTALKELLELGTKGLTSYLERPGQPELRERSEAVREAREARDLAQAERELGLTD